MHQDYLNELLISQCLNNNTFSLVYCSNTNNSCSSHLFESTCYHYFKPTLKSLWGRNESHSVYSYPERMKMVFAPITRHVLNIFLSVDIVNWNSYRNETMMLWGKLDFTFFEGEEVLATKIHTIYPWPCAFMKLMLSMYSPLNKTLLNTDSMRLIFWLSEHLPYYILKSPGYRNLQIFSFLVSIFPLKMWFKTGKTREHGGKGTIALN